MRYLKKFSCLCRARHRQENFFKYLKEEYALDALVDYATEPADPTREIPNPRWHEIDGKLRRARADLFAMCSMYGVEAFVNVESRRKTMRGFKIANAKIAAPLAAAFRRCTRLEAKRAKVPRRIPVGQTTHGAVIKLATERKHISNVLKMVAYQAEGELVRRISPHYRRADDEGRTLIQSLLAAPADIHVSATDIHVTISELSSPHRTYAAAALCEDLNRNPVCFPGTRLRLRYSVAEG